MKCQTTFLATINLWHNSRLYEASLGYEAGLGYVKPVFLTDFLYFSFNFLLICMQVSAPQISGAVLRLALRATIRSGAPTALRPLGAQRSGARRSNALELT